MEWELLNHLENMELCKAGSAENSWDITGFEQMLQILNDRIPMLKENNLTTGILANELLANIYFDCVARDATIHQLRDTYVAHLRSVVEVQFYINQLLYDLVHNVPIDTVKKYECFLLFYFIEQVFFDGTHVTRQYHFKSEATTWCSFCCTSWKAVCRSATVNAADGFLFPGQNEKRCTATASFATIKLVKSWQPV